MLFDYLNPILSQTFLGNTLWRMVASVFVMLITSGLFFLVMYALTQGFFPFLGRKKVKEDTHIFEIYRTIKTPTVLFIAFFAGSRVLILPALLDTILAGICTILVGYHVLLAIELLASYFIRKKLQNEEGDEFAISIFGILLKWAIWVIGIVLILANLGINVTSLVAGLGIGGVAIALASQNVISDLISYFAIHFDRPFVIGDYITMGDISGRVEKIGIKTTRIRGKDSEEVIIPNKEITSKLLQNYKKREERKIKFECIITSPVSEKIVGRLEEALKKTLTTVKSCQFHYAHIHDFADTGSACTIACFIPSSNDLTFMKNKEEVFLKIREVFEKEKIEVK